ncbi:hypothetical protein BD413DRAFT_477311 [Trametes elegans]|nr:hypothetical protein BD413DRAFT_477311 [Trametes elegans]
MESEPRTNALNRKKGKKGAKRSSVISDPHSRDPSRGLETTRITTPIPVASSTREDVLQAALLASASGRPFEDVKFFAFSRLTHTGDVDTPLPLFANSTLIRKASSHFDYLITQGFAESGFCDLDAPYPSTRQSCVDDYDYVDDSDLDEEEFHYPPSPLLEDEHPASPPGLVENVECGGRDSGIGKTQVPTGSKGDHAVASSGGYTSAAKFGRPGRIVFLDDIAYKTWKVFIAYAYLGDQKLTFAPLKSEGKAAAGWGKPSGCSPKSMYRLAEKYDIELLRALSIDQIKASLHPHNILQEIFSTFTSLYPAIQSIELDFLLKNINENVISDQLPTWIDAMEEGHLPRGASRIVSSLVARLATQPKIKSCPYGCKSQSTCYCPNCGRQF